MGLLDIFSNKLSESNAYEIAALNAFANVTSNKKKITLIESLENISNNLVEIYSYSDTNVIKGSGILITTGGYILTADHVIEDALDKKLETYIIKQDKSKHKINLDETIRVKKRDIALIKAKTGIIYSEPIRMLVDLEGKLSYGDEIRVLGFRDKQKYIMLGIIKEVSRISKMFNDPKKSMYEDMFLTDARGIEGLSGGSIVNHKGELTGIISFSEVAPFEKLGSIGGGKVSYALGAIKVKINSLSSAHYK